MRGNVGIEEMEIFIINVMIASGLTGIALFRRHRGKSGNICVTLLLVLPLYLTLNWMAGYRALAQPPRDKMEKQVLYRDAWFEGVFAMHSCTFNRYVPKVIPYLVCLGILAFNRKQREIPTKP